MAPDLVADQLDLDLIQAHMLSGSTLLWKPVNWEASKLVFAQTRRYILDNDLRRAVDSFGGNCIHKSMTLLLEKSGISQGAELICQYRFSAHRLDRQCLRSGWPDQGA
jgi:hypothetical protein